MPAASSAGLGPAAVLRRWAGRWLEGQPYDSDVSSSSWAKTTAATAFRREATSVSRAEAGVSLGRKAQRRPECMLCMKVEKRKLGSL